MSTISTSKRRVRYLSAVYFSVEVDPTDPLGERLVSVVRTGGHDEEIELTAAEEKRLDGLGALYEPGVSEGETREQDQAKLDAYRAARGDRTAVEATMKRALASGPEQITPLPQEHVSPPPGGNPPVGTFTLGDRGAGDVQPDGSTASVVKPPAGGIVRADAPDVAVASPAEIAAWITEAKPNAADTVALAEGDPAQAAKVLEAEHIATGGDPRGSVAKPLGQIAPTV
jgi:hypothetical protein